jgi:hypothetical protein
MSLGSVTRISLIKSAGLLGILSLACCAASSGSSRAADLSGFCCADLEERIAELESAAVRKGNRKVELTISGWVAEQIVHWRDPGESNTYVTSLGTIFASNFTLTGRASISKDTAAGFKLQIEFDDNNVYTTTQDRDNGPAGSPVVYAHWFLHSGTFGKLSLGKVSPADDSAVVSIDGSGTVVAAYGVAYDVFSFGVRGPFARGDSLIWGNAASCRGYGGGPGDCNGLPSNAVRYDSPSSAGFSATASWGEDDNWALAARYAGETRDFKLAGIVTYSETSTPAQGAPPGGHLAYTQASFYLEHMASGGFIDAAWGRIDEEPNLASFPATDVYYLKAGARLRLAPPGATVPYAELLYATDGAGITNNNGTPQTSDDTFRIVSDSSTTFWGLGVVQEVDAAAMSLWLRYRHHEADIPGVAAGDIGTVAAGAFISY